MRSLLSWLRLVLPPTTWIGGFLLIYLGAEANHWLRVKIGVTDREEIAGPCIFVLALGCSAFGSFRVTFFHPAFRARYREWLESTPWTSRQALPLGPVHLVWQDAIYVAVLGMAGLAHAITHPLLLPIVFAFVYLLTLSVSLFVTREWPFGYLVLLGMGLMVRLMPDVPVAGPARYFANAPFVMVVAIASYVVGLIGLRRSLAEFPWSREGAKLVQWTAKFQFQVTSATRGPEVGWPFDRLNPQRPKLRISIFTATLLCVQLGWWLYAALVHWQEHWSVPVTGATALIWGLYWTFLLATFGLRTLVYIISYSPPISLLGRIFTLRWIIPGYDEVFITPWVVLIVGSVLPTALAANDVSVHVYVAVSAAVVLWLALCLGPTVESWRTTGSHRMVPLASQTQFSNT